MVDKMETNVRKFDGREFSQWKFQIKFALKAKYLYGVADGSKPMSTTGKKGDLTAMSIVISAMCLDQISFIKIQLFLRNKLH